MQSRTDPDPIAYTSAVRVRRRIGYQLWRLVANVITRVACRAERRGMDSMPPGPWIMVGAHISHFDSLMVIGASPRKLDAVMAAELYDNPWLSRIIRSMDGLPFMRSEQPGELRDGGALRKLDRVAYLRMKDRLARGRIILVSPEGGIRTGAQSVLEGGPWPSGTAALAIRCGVPIRPCLSLGADQLYVRRRWLRGVRLIHWLGEPVWPNPQLRGVEQREEMMRRCGDQLRGMYQRVLAEHPEADDLVPRTAQERWRQAGLL